MCVCVWVHECVCISAYKALTFNLTCCLFLVERKSHSEIIECVKRRRSDSWCEGTRVASLFPCFRTTSHLCLSACHSYQRIKYIWISSPHLTSSFHIHSLLMKSKGQCLLFAACTHRKSYILPCSTVSILYLCACIYSCCCFYNCFNSISHSWSNIIKHVIMLSKLVSGKVELLPLYVAAPSPRTLDSVYM